MFSLWEATILGIVQGVTEFLPISSTGHLILASKLLALPASEFLTSFIIAIQAGSILAVLFLYGRSLSDWEFDKKVLAAFVPTAVIGFLLYKIIKTFFLTSDLLVAVMLVVGGLVMIWLERRHKLNNQPELNLNQLTYRSAIIIGLCQSLAMIPGVSRSAATIFGGLALGLTRSAILEFSFILAIPTMLAATGYDLFKHGLTFNPGEASFLMVGIAVSFLVSLAAIKWLLSFVRRHNFTGFGIYRIVVGLGWILIFWLV